MLSQVSFLLLASESPGETEAADALEEDEPEDCVWDLGSMASRAGAPSLGRLRNRGRESLRYLQGQGGEIPGGDHTVGTQRRHTKGEKLSGAPTFFAGLVGGRRRRDGWRTVRAWIEGGKQSTCTSTSTSRREREHGVGP